MPTKHSKKAGTMGSEALTYHERKALGFGTARERLGKDSLGNFYDCRLTLTPAADPVACPSGFIFSHEAIIENLLAQKKENKRRLAAWEQAQATQERKTAERDAVEKEASLLAFDRRNHAGASDTLASQLHDAVTEEAEALMAEKHTTSSVNNIKDNEARMVGMKSFWVPSQGKEAAETVEKPDGSTRCPASGKKLKLKDLIRVKITPVTGGEPGEYMDPVTRDPLTNASKLILIKPTGDVVLEATWKKCIKPDGAWQGVAVSDDDVLELKRGGTGFVEHDGDGVQAKRYFALGAGNGLADRRGQGSAGTGSKFGLSLGN
jgi:nitric oxide synthase-interacting protein